MPNTLIHTSANAAPFDTYFAMLEKSGLRQIGLMRYGVRHKTPFFSESSYSASCGTVFPDESQAYAHWMAVGRCRGDEWAPGRDTLLKIVLKAKDESYLIDAWVAHHAAIVGYENLIILDCGSQDATYIEKLASYASRILVLDYRRYYDSVHATRSNPDFFGLLAANCRYLTILDADEFLFARTDDLFSGQFVKPVLRARNLPIVCGIWVNATAGCGGPTALCDIDVSHGMLLSGAVSGKATARHDVVFAIGHLRHNLHVADVLPFVHATSFGELFVLHLKNLPREVTRERMLQHLVTKGAVSATDGPERETQIVALAEAADTPPAVKSYAQHYLRPEPEAGSNSVAHIVSAALINATSAHAIPALAAALAAIDWEALLETRRASLGKA